MDKLRHNNAFPLFFLAWVSMVLWNCALVRENRPD